MHRLIGISFLLAALSIAGADAGPIVAVTGGQVHGEHLEKGGAAFKGIPYAQPPVGDLRWREPMPVKPWTGVRSATAFGAICPQPSSPVAPTAQELSSEDCLSLNIWTSEWPARSRRPVMVMIPGGGNYSGGSNERAFESESLPRRGVVLVTLNYRLGTFGFFSHPDLTRESPHHASGNQGILDQIAALRWVRDNISKFGGDPQNVTLLGGSAGSLNISALMTSPLSKGLFRRAIGASGTVLLLGPALSLDQGEERGRSLVTGWKVAEKSSLSDLRSVPMAHILKADPNYFLAPPPNLGLTVDGYVFRKAPAEVFTTGRQHRVPLLMGSNSRETIPGSRAPADLWKAIGDTYGPLAERAKASYTETTDPMYGTAIDQWCTDTSFRCPAVAQLIWHAQAGNGAYEYEFARVLPGREAFSHGSDVAYIFGTLDKGLFPYIGPPATPTAIDTQLSETMQSYFTNFAKSGDPNGPGLPLWPRFAPGSRSYMQFGDTGAVAKAGLRTAHCDLFIENVKRTSAK